MADEIERIARALEAIAREVEKLANPPVSVSWACGVCGRVDAHAPGCAALHARLNGRIG